MKKFIVLFFAVLLIAAAWFFLTDDATSPPVTESEKLNEMLRSAPISRITLHRGEIDTLVLPADRIIEPRITTDETFSTGEPTQVKPFGEHLVVMEYSSVNIAAITRDGETVAEIGGDELQRPSNIMSDGERLFIYDDGRKLIHIYDADYRFIESTPFNNSYYTQGSVVMNREHIAFQHEDASGFRVSESGRQLLSVVAKENPESIIFEAIPRIVPAGKHPGGYNNLILSMNNRSDIAAAFPALPYLFVYRNFEHHQSIVLDAEEFAEIENPDLTPFQPVMGEAVRISSLMELLYLRDNGDILLFSSGLLHHLRLQRSGSYSHYRSYALVRGDTGESIQNVSSLDTFPNQPQTMYATSQGILFELRLPE